MVTGNPSILIQTGCYSTQESSSGKGVAHKEWMTSPFDPVDTGILSTMAVLSKA